MLGRKFDLTLILFAVAIIIRQVPGVLERIDAVGNRIVDGPEHGFFGVQQYRLFLMRDFDRVLVIVWRFFFLGLFILDYDLVSLDELFFLEPLWVGVVFFYHHHVFFEFFVETLVDFAVSVRADVGLP